MRQLVAMGVVCFIYLISNSALGYEVKELTLEEKVRIADVVVIGRALSIDRIKKRYADLEYTLVKIETTLKGDPPDEIFVLSKGGISEGNTDCCKVGDIYLFFLVKTKEKYESANGRFGIYVIRTKHTP